VIFLQLFSYPWYGLRIRNRQRGIKLHRKLDALTGYSPNKFIRGLRLETAKELLQDPANSIAVVAMEHGYDDPILQGYLNRSIM